MIKWIQKKAYIAGLKKAQEVIEAKVAQHQEERNDIIKRGLDGGEITACITCLVAIGREIAKLMAK